MESTAEYLARKAREIEFWNAQLREPIEMEPLRSVRDVVSAKFKLRAALQAEAAAESWQMTESNWVGQPSFSYHDCRVDYAYQRFDLSIHGPAIYPCLQHTSAGAAWTSGCSYSSSGMAAIAATLLALQDAAPGSTLCLAQDGYFGTQCLCRRHTPLIRLVVLNGCDDYAEAHAQDSTNPVALMLDSICQADPTVGLDHVAAALPDVLLLDTTCYEVSDPRIARVVEFAVEHERPLIMVRSHIKLDCCGIEYARLGSTVCVKPRALRGGRLALLRALLAGHRSAVSRLGLRAQPLSLLPFAAHPDYRALNRERVHRIDTSNRWLAQALSVRAVERVTQYHHSKFVTVEPLELWNRQRLLETIDAFSASARRDGLGAWRADSFGFDFIALTTIMDLKTERDVYRIAAADVPEAELSRFVDAWLATALHAEGGIPVHSVC